MDPQQAATAKGEKVLALLRQKIHEAGLSFREVEQRMGLGKDYLRHLLSGRVDLKLKHVLAVLEVLEVHPAVFFAQTYGYTAHPSSPGDELYQHLPPGRRPVRSGAVWYIAMKLKERGILSAEEVDSFVREFERDERRV